MFYRSSWVLLQWWKKEWMEDTPLDAFDSVSWDEKLLQLACWNQVLYLEQSTDTSMIDWNI
jgi:hypothetical protein